MTPQEQAKDFDYDHSVTSTNTVMHWILYALDAIEAEGDELEDEMNPREYGVKPERVYHYASDENDESIVFRGVPEVRWQMKQLATDRYALARRTDETGWHDDDVDWYYRLNEEGRKALLDLGIPEYLPNRRDPEFDRQLPMEPNHEPGWWLTEDEQPDFDVEEGWKLGDNNWLSSDYERVYYKDAGDREMCNARGYVSFGEELAEAFPEVTFVLTCGPYRPHDLMYRIRDPFKKVVQIDVYSPMAMHRSSDEITDAFTSLVTDLHHALQQATEEFEDE